ncbi:MAG TPA: peptidylprolyl isomerase [Gammaproteobacteria bacterium]|jgi:peptidyl-prolyl cis-trans isomerase B (cyclophilin B)
MKVRLETTLGDITLELFESEAPKTVANFLQYVSEGHYDGTIFHRVIDGFMIQGGGFEPGMDQKPARGNVENEADNGLSNDAGTIAMARTPDPHSASTQFFINANDNDFLNFRAKTQEGWGYCVFGKVVDGMEVVTRIEESPTTTRAGHQDVPREDIVINRAVAVD